MTTAKYLLTRDTAKIEKTRMNGVWEAVLYMSPATESVPFGGVNMCAYAGACAYVCLGNHSGRMVMPAAKQARIARTLMFLRERETFYSMLAKEILRHVKACRKIGVVPAFRPNGSQDHRGLGAWVAAHCAELYPDARVYDYTKIPPTAADYRRKNYHLTYSFSERPEAKRVALAHLERGGSVSVVFDVRKGEPLPPTWNGYPVIDGDKSDARFMDPAGSVVGLRLKGKCVKDNFFVVLAA
jgi:hypothetical protein